MHHLTSPAAKAAFPASSLSLIVPVEPYSFGGISFHFRCCLGLGICHCCKVGRSQCSGSYDTTYKLKLHMTLISAQHRNLTPQLVLPLQNFYLWCWSLILTDFQSPLELTSIPPSVLDLNRPPCRAFGLSTLLIFLP